MIVMIHWLRDCSKQGVLTRRSGVIPEQVDGTGWDIALRVSQICFVDRFQVLLSHYAWVWVGVGRLALGKVE